MAQTASELSLEASPQGSEVTSRNDIDRRPLPGKPDLYVDGG